VTIVIVGWVDRAIELFAASPTNIPIKIGRETARRCVLPKIQISRRETARRCVLNMLCPEYTVDN
jgi:hypothetical protein